MKTLQGEFDVIYADPPWRYSVAPPRKSDSIEAHYPTMSLEEICALKIPAAKNAVLYLWGTAPLVPEAVKVIDAWGFKFKTCAVWDKELIGLGYWFRGQHELLMVATKGNFSPPAKEHRISSILKERRTEHSKKPSFIRDHIARARIPTRENSRCLPAFDPRVGRSSVTTRHSTTGVI